MDRLQKKLNEQYTVHYKRINQSIEWTSLNPRQLGVMNLMYGKFVDSLPEPSKVLDLGCGTGFLLHWLSGYSNIIPVGVDSSQMQVEIAQKNFPDMEVSCADGLEFLRQHPNTFNGIFCNDVLEHIPDNYLFDWVEGIVHALRPGGFLICRTPNGANMMSGYSRYMDLTHQRCFTRTSISQLLEVGGLVDCRTIPIQAVHLTGKIRLNLEWIVHKGLFLLTGRGLETVFTSNVVAVGFKPQV